MTGSHLSGPEEGFDVVWLKGQDIPARVQSVIKMLQLELRGGQVVQTLQPVFPNLFLLCLHTSIPAVCADRETFGTKSMPCPAGCFMGNCLFLLYTEKNQRIKL